MNQQNPERIELPELSFGCASIGNLFEAISDEDANAVLNEAWNLGFRYFDTAPHYGRGRSEIRLGNFLKNRSGFCVSTKVGRVLTPANAPIAEADGFVNPCQNNVHYDYSSDGILQSFEQSRERLQMNNIDILFVHDLGAFVHGADSNKYLQQFLESGYEALIKLREQGLIRAFGLGVNECQVCVDILGYAPLDVILLAGRYTLLEQKSTRELFPLCEANNVQLVIGGVFNSGILATGSKNASHYNYSAPPKEIIERVAQLESVCAQFDTPLAAVALQFPRRNSLVASTLIGTSKVKYLKRNVAQFSTPISPEIWDELARQNLIDEAPEANLTRKE